MQLNVLLKNCYGIEHLEESFKFNREKKSFAIYAPNGLMKSSFAKTFHDLSNKKPPKEERYGRATTCEIDCNGAPLTSQEIYVLKSDVDLNSEKSAVTKILIHPENKSRYDDLLFEVEDLKSKLINSLQKSSKLKKTSIENAILSDFNEVSFAECIQKSLEVAVDEDLDPYEYAVIFDPKVIEVIKSSAFGANASKFNQRYQELFNQENSIYKKGVFNPAKADVSFSTLSKQGFFDGGHRVHLKDDTSSIGKEELDKKLQELHIKIDGDSVLKKLRLDLAKNAQTQSFTSLIERLTAEQIEFFLENIKPASQVIFRQLLWAFYIQKSPEASIYIQSYNENKAEILRIETESASLSLVWNDCIELFNNRFIDMPFSLSVENLSQSALGKEPPKLKLNFSDGNDTANWSSSETKTLSQGEKRALYLLYFIFEVESRKVSAQKTFFIIDDIADSFDYKNKHAIIQYLSDLDKTEYFYQIILTHNFDFFRTLNTTFVSYDCCLMANRCPDKISLAKASGVRNYFIGKWKDNVATCQHILCATIPFTRNLIEYIKGDKDNDYLMLTNLLHWKEATNTISVGQYLDIYNRLFSTEHIVSNEDQPLIEMLFESAEEITNRTTQDGLILEDKVLMSIAIRIEVTCPRKLHHPEL